MTATTHKLFLATLAALVLAGCSSRMIGTREGAEEVVLADATKVAHCKTLGKTTVSVMSSVGPITRSAENVEDNLVQMARNDAVSRGGDTVVKGNSMSYGTRTFEIFKCKP